MVGNLEINKKYLFEILKSILLWTLIPNIFLFIFWKYNNVFSFVPTLTLFFNSIILPIALIFAAKYINSKYHKNWWYLNYIFFASCTLFSIFINLFNWMLSVEKGKGFYENHTIDKGTWMIINLEMIVSLGILGVGLIYEIIKSVPEKNEN